MQLCQFGLFLTCWTILFTFISLWGRSTTVERQKYFFIILSKKYYKCDLAPGWMFPSWFEPVFSEMTTFESSAEYCREIQMIPSAFVSLSKNANKINPNHTFVWGKQSSNYAVVSGYASTFSLWFNSVYLSMSHFRITAKRMNMKVMGKRNENEGWVSLRIISGTASTWSASMSVKLHPQWWWLIRFSHAQQIMLIERNILQLNSRLTCTDSIVNRVSCAVLRTWFEWRIMVDITDSCFAYMQWQVKGNSIHK